MRNYASVAMAVTWLALADPAQAVDVRSPEGPVSAEELLDLEGNHRSTTVLLQACTNDASLTFCQAYLAGAADQMVAFGAGGHKAGICPTHYTAEALRTIFVDWINKHPELLKIDMAATANLALRSKWPCGSPPGPGR